MRGFVQLVIPKELRYRLDHPPSTINHLRTASLLVRRTCTQPTNFSTVSINMKNFNNMKTPETTTTARINLIRGWPAPELLPAHLIASATTRILTNPSLSSPSLHYGADAGYQPLREALATWLSGHFGVARDAERICISGGASQNLACILQAFTDPAVTRRVWMVAPCYHLACRIFEDAGFAARLGAFPEDEEGVDLDELERRIRDVEAIELIKGEVKPFKTPSTHQKFYRHVIYVVPTCANPSGKTMSLRRRQGLVRLARKYDALIVCDDVYDFLQWPLNGSAESMDDPEMRLPRLCDIDLAMGQADDDPRGFGYAVSNASFSKMAGPGVRTGWLEGSRAFAHGLSQVGSTMSGGSPSQLCASIMAGMLQNGELQEYLAKTVRPGLQRRHRLLMDAVHEHLTPLGVQTREAGLVGGKVYGGYFVWLTLPEDYNAKIVAQVALLDDLIVGNGSMFEVHQDERSVTFDRQIRLTFAFVPEEQLREGVERLATVMRKIKENPEKYSDLSSKDDAPTDENK